MKQIHNFQRDALNEEVGKQMNLPIIQRQNPKFAINNRANNFSVSSFNCSVYTSRMTHIFSAV